MNTRILICAALLLAATGSMRAEGDSKATEVTRLRGRRSATRSSTP